MGNIRLLPFVAFAAFCLLILKTAGIVFSGGYVLSGYAPAVAQEPQAAGNEEGADAQQAAPGEQAGAQAPANANPAAPAQPAQGPGPGNRNLAGPVRRQSESETDVLESLARRRREIEKQAEQLRLRENLLKAAENQVANRIAELKAIEARISQSLKKRDEVETQQLARLVNMYSKMKPAKAARIFDRLDIKILKDLVGQMKTRSMAPILAAMNPARAEQLTLEIANAKKGERPDLSDLPKIPSKDPG